MLKNISDCYKILNINKKASPIEIKKAYKMLLKQYHPDLNKASVANDKFKRIVQAYQTLTDPVLREELEKQSNHISFFPQIKNLLKSTDNFINVLKDTKNFYSQNAPNKIKSLFEEKKINHNKFNIPKNTWDDYTDNISQLILDLSVEELGNRLLYSANSYVRLTAAKALGLKGERRAYKYLLQAINDADKNIRFTVIESLGNLKMKKTLPLLEKMLLMQQNDSELKKLIKRTCAIINN